MLVGNGLVEAVCAAVDDRTWVERDFIESRRDEALLYGWREFCRAIQHETRYVFFLRPDEDDLGPGYIPTGRILRELGELICDEGLVSELPAGHQLWRARIHTDPDSAANWGARDMGTAPLDAAKAANRMSPAGIPLFYGSVDSETAVREAAVRVTDDQEWVTVAAFETSRSCWVVDLTRLAAPPSMFDAAQWHRRRPLIFLHKFVDDLKKPARPTWEQLDYVPTQVVTEYFLRVFDPGVPIAGLLYPSTQTNQPSVALDVSNNACVAQENGLRGGESVRLGLVPETAQARRINP